MLMHSPCRRTKRQLVDDLKGLKGILSKLGTIPKDAYVDFLPHVICSTLMHLSYSSLVTPLKLKDRAADVETTTDDLYARCLLETRNANAFALSQDGATKYRRRF